MNAQNFSYRLWVPPEPNCLADLIGYLVDLDEAKRCLERLLLIPPSTDDTTISEALSTAAIIRYCRCFTSGSRQKLDISALLTVSSDEIAAHDRMRGIRDWHIAHPINLQEINAIHLIVSEDSDAAQLVLGISAYQASDPAFKGGELYLAISLCTKWIDNLQSRFVEEQQRLKPHIEKLSRDEVLALPIEEPEPNANIRARRKQGHYK